MIVLLCSNLLLPVGWTLYACHTCIGCVGTGGDRNFGQCSIFEPSSTVVLVIILRLDSNNHRALELGREVIIWV